MIRRALLLLIRGYQICVSPLLPKGLCRFEPSCSRYAAEAIRTHGARRGASLAARRIMRCRPGGGHGYDPVPLDAGDAASSALDHSPRT